MPTLTATVSGRLRQSQFAFVSGGTAWRAGQPQLSGGSNTASATNNQDTDSQGLYMLFSYSGATISVTDIRFQIISFDVSSISSIPASAQLKIFGNTNSATGNPSSHSTDGIQGWAIKDNGMASTTSVSAADWGEIYASGPTAPTLLTDNLTSWNVGTSTPNTFTINSAGRTIIGNESLFQICIGHKFWHDNFDANPPFAHGNNSPNGDNDFTAIAGVYHGFGGSQAAYKPTLVIPDTVPGTGPIKIGAGAKFSISSGKFTIN